MCAQTVNKATASDLQQNAASTCLTLHYLAPAHYPGMLQSTQRCKQQSSITYYSISCVQELLHRLQTDASVQPAGSTVSSRHEQHDRGTRSCCAGLLETCLADCWGAPRLRDLPDRHRSVLCPPAALLLNEH